MKCTICGAEMLKKQMDVDKAWKGRTITFRGLDVQVCEGCGIKVYDSSDVELMESFVEGTLEKSDYPKVMNVEEVSRFLRITPQSVYNMLRDGRISATKVGREWRFSKESIMSIFDKTEPILCYRSNESGADKVQEELEKFGTELRIKDQEKKEAEKEE